MLSLCVVTSPAMASLREKPNSPFFTACYTGADGRRIQRSTKQSDRRKAQVIADKWEEAAKLAGEKRLGEKQARRVLSEIYQVLNDEPLPSSSAREFLEGWAERRKADTAPRTHAAYGQVCRDFLETLGPRAEHDVSQLTKSDILRYRDSVLKRTSVGTANKCLKILRVALGAAFKDGLSQENPAGRVDTIKRRVGDATKRRPFTLDELKAILSHASDEWRGIILFGLYTGQRLKDIARLTWQNVDAEKNELRFVSAKTNRRMHLPLAKPLVNQLEHLPSGDEPSQPLFPAAYQIATKPKEDSRLSQQFYEILFAAGLVKIEQGRKETGEGHKKRRRVNEISFHSLRHTANSLLKNAGVPDAVVMDLIGHDSDQSSERYTHIDQQAKRRALTKIPDITGLAGPRTK
jgi:integrase